MRGWVYVIGHEALPAHVRLGYSMMDPRGLLAELDTYPLPGRSRLLYETICEDSELLASRAAARLADCSADKGWFRCSSARALAVIEEELESIREEILASQREEILASQDGDKLSTPLEMSRVAGNASAEATVKQGGAEQVQDEPQLEIEYLREEPAFVPPAIRQVAPDYDAQYGQRREALLERYDFLLRRTMPDTHLWSYFFGLLVTGLVIMELFFNLAPRSMFVSATVFALLGAPIIRSILLERHKQSPRYRQLLAQREQELEELELEYQRRIAFSAQFRHNEVAA